MGRAEEKKQQKQASLMDTAFQLFISQGIIKTSISDIAERAGVAKGTFYLYFKDKYDLQEKLVVHKSEQVFRHALECSGFEALDSEADKLLAIVDDILFQMRDNPYLLRFLNKKLSWDIFRKVIERTETGNSGLLERIKTAVRSGDSAVEIELYTVMELVGAASYNVILNGQPVELEAYIPYLHRAICAILDGFRGL